MFIICAIPQLVSFGYFFEELSSSQAGIVFPPFTDIINFTFMGFHFMVYFGMNVIFRNECIFQVRKFRKIIAFKCGKCFLSEERLRRTSQLYERRNSRFYNDSAFNMIRKKSVVKNSDGW